MIIAEKSDATSTMKRNGKSFWFASLFLPRQVAADAARLYAFCRTMDDLADVAVSQESRATLAQVRGDLKRGVTSIPDVQDFFALAHQYQLPCVAAEYLVATFIQDATAELHIEDEDQLVRYCYGVAGTVGLMMSPILGAHRQQADEAAIHLGIAMQMTNIARDVLEDASNHRRYLPGCWVQCLTPQQILNASESRTSYSRELVASAVLRLLELADRYYASASTGFPYIPTRARRGIEIAAAVYREIGEKLRRNDGAWWERQNSRFVFAKTLDRIAGVCRAIANPSPESQRPPGESVTTACRPAGSPMTNQPSTRERELIILGGGCAGLSLAARLVQNKPEIALTVVESRARYEEDRTWCGWRIAPHFFSDCVVSHWDKWRIGSSQQSLLLESRRYPYEMVRASLVYEKACASIHSSPTAELLMRTSADEVVENLDEVFVTLSDRTVVRSPWVIDTRPQRRTLTKPWLWQNFVGYVVQCEAATDIEDDTPVLMEFQPPGGSVAQFMYKIPFGENQFLFECTRFSTVRGEDEVLEQALLHWLHQHLGSRWQLRRREAGSLPMAPPLPTDQQRVIQAGTRGGNMRISTGYAFHRIQRWADICADSILRTGKPISPASNRLLDAMDEIFLRVLQQPSTSAANLFTDLFASCPTDRLIRFLSGVPLASDYWPVASGLPWGKFLQETPALAGAWLRGAEGLI